MLHHLPPPLFLFSVEHNFSVDLLLTKTLWVLPDLESHPPEVLPFNPVSIFSPPTVQTRVSWEHHPHPRAVLTFQGD